MAVAAVSPPETKNPSTPTPLWMASLVGGVFVLASMGAIFYGVPQLWAATLGPALKTSLGGLFNGALLLLAQVVAAIALVIFGSRLAGDKPLAGIRGGIFLSISTIFTVFYLARAVGMIGQSWFSLANPVAMGVFIGAVVGFGLLGLRFLRGKKFARWAHTLEDAGWFSTFTHKRSQGRTVRRLTIIALLIIFGAGIQTLINNQHLIGMNDWEVVTPFLPRIVLLPDAQFTVPLLLIFLALWTSWRAVNYPPFADFLIATEAEMNKVSWTPRKALIKDTFVVLTCVFIIAMFIFIVDIFWGWLLSRELVGVLPRSTSYYYIEISELPEDKRESIVQILTSEAIQYPVTDAQKTVEAIPTKFEEGKSTPVRIKSLQQRDVKRSGFEDDLSSRLVRRFSEAGAKVIRVPAKDDAKNVW
jgi:preprotein translocase SecE subunit